MSAVASVPIPARADLEKLNAMKKRRYHRGRWSGSLAHLAALDAVGAALATLLADKATAQSGQARL